MVKERNKKERRKKEKKKTQFVFHKNRIMSKLKIMIMSVVQFLFFFLVCFRGLFFFFLRKGEGKERNERARFEKRFELVGKGWSGEKETRN